MKFYLPLILVFAFVLVACEHKVEPVQVTGLNEYRDPAYGFRIKYPQEWKQFGTAGRAEFAKSQEVINKFLVPTSGEEGAMVTVEVIPFAGTPASELIDSTKTSFRETFRDVIQMDPEQAVNVAGKEAMKVPYRIQATTKTSIYGYQVFVPGDTAMYRLDFRGYGDQFNAHTAVFDTMRQSFELPVVVAKRPDVWQPSTETQPLETQYFTLRYPENMESMPVSKGTNDYSAKFRADRLDCSIQIDVFGAKGNSVEKVFDQNKGRVRARATGETSIAGQKALWVEDQAMANVMRRQYYVVKSDKVIRPTITWYAPQREVYFPVLEGIARSMKLK